MINLAVMYDTVLQAETMGYKGMFFGGFWEDHKILLLGNWRHEVLGVFCFRDEIVILLVLQNFNEFFVDSWRCVLWGDVGKLSCLVGGIHIL